MSALAKLELLLLLLPWGRFEAPPAPMYLAPHPFRFSSQGTPCTGFVATGTLVLVVLVVLLVLLLVVLLLPFAVGAGDVAWCG